MPSIDTRLSLWYCGGKRLGYGDEDLATDHLSSNSSYLPIGFSEHHHGVLWENAGSPPVQTVIYCIYSHNEHSIRHQRKFILISLDYGYADLPNNSFHYLWMLWRWVVLKVYWYKIVSAFSPILARIHHFSSSSSSLSYLVCFLLGFIFLESDYVIDKVYWIHSLRGFA